ncbi:MAG: hypothetical protein LBU61_06580, partial [Coriobacteriales bacterium]|nr:hypothetical protein [Coriobacteriales bacterium]
MEYRFANIVSKAAILALAALLFIALFCSGCTDKQTEENQPASTTVNSSQDHFVSLEISREQYKTLIASFSQKPIPAAADYPDWYGGSFMNDQGRLVIYVTPEYTETEELSKVKD